MRGISQILSEILGNEYITAVAIKRGEDVFDLPKPSRHNDVIRDMRNKGFKRVVGDVQGFLTNHGTFLDRIEGAKLALDCGQVDELKHPPYLYSEDLW